jgi:hypothetical protein
METYKWYLYQLIDPRDQTVFYIGKGTGKRIYAHEKEARNGVCSNKCNKIKEIWSANLDIDKKIIAYFNDEQYAYQVEADWIRQTPNLTNNGFIVKSDNKIFPFIVPLYETCYEAVSAYMGEFAYWFKHSSAGSKKAQCSFKHNGTKEKICSQAFNAAYNVIFPRCLTEIRKSPKHEEMLADELKHYGVSYGS